MSGKCLLYYSPTSCNNRLEKHSEIPLLPLGYKIFGLLQTKYWVYNIYITRHNKGCTIDRWHNNWCSTDNWQERILGVQRATDKTEYWVFKKQLTRLILGVQQTTDKTEYWVFKKQLTRQNTGCSKNNWQDRILGVQQTSDKTEYWVFNRQVTRQNTKYCVYSTQFTGRKCHPNQRWDGYFFFILIVSTNQYSL